LVVLSVNFFDLVGMIYNLVLCGLPKLAVLIPVWCLLLVLRFLVRLLFDLAVAPLVWCPSVRPCVWRKDLLRLILASAEILFS
jgi:hypothetical protein